MTTLTVIDPDKKFRGGADIAPDPDSGKELGELIYDIQTAVNTIGNATVESTHAGLALRTLNNEVSAALNGTATKKFIPEGIDFVVTAITGAPNGDAIVTVGTTAGGTQILPATSLTGLNAVGETFPIQITGILPSIAGTGTLYVKCTTADTGGGSTLTATARIYGREV
ncbi:MAG: hypothetical protein PHX83_06800 [Acidobacteriia bacterium]|nr:hypothetical protein [Terriglobia bacterium]